MIHHFTVTFTNGLTLTYYDAINATDLKECGHPDKVGIEEIIIHYMDGTKSVFVPE